MGQDVVLKDEEIGKTLLDDPHPEAEHGHRTSDLAWPEARVEKPPVTFANVARITGVAVQAFLEDDVSEPHFAQLGQRVLGAPPKPGQVDHDAPVGLHFAECGGKRHGL
jgi:hypothetical protein